MVLKEKTHIIFIMQGAIIVTIISLFFSYMATLFPVSDSENMNNINAAIDGKLLWIVFPLLISPIIEELVFRKWIPNAFQESIGRKGSILFSNILFAFFHFDLYFLPYLFNGLIYSYFYDKTKDIKVPIVIHIIYNFIVFLLTFICR
ncbi:hypothetical protein BME96_18945 (plasmid) [Virgibacillus halodenitrificans]|uniref:CAAX prenyl protease 2/Lysostaphin resistance protein A-like domain-containing protein n=2 Tax=Virgibacillus halodenitrificans TaxID=1482 RepID=A0AAC9J2G8_VIRHA|nr:hypothetical protein BME96_18945 [Virgibacillus halodenitrificans]AVD54448.1 CPBP family intramembrane metalloprotease [Priestia filamentosa]